MGLHTDTKAEGRFLTVVAGKLREKVEEGTEGATKRTGEVAGVPFEKWELVYPGITAKITKVELQDGKYGKNVLIHMTDDNDESFIVSLGAENSSTGVPFMSALPNIDLTKDVTLKPYPDFVTKEGVQKRAGLSIKQDGSPVKDAFYDFEKKENLLGMPKAEPNKKGDINWKLYFAQRDEWLQTYMLDNGFMTEAVYEPAEEGAVEVAEDDDSF